MAAAFTLARAEYAERHERMATLRERAGELRAQALELAERELTVYGAVLDALRLPEDAPGRAPSASTRRSPTRPTARWRWRAPRPRSPAWPPRSRAPATATCAATPSPAPSWPRRACTAAARLAEINLTGRPGDPRREEAAELPRRALQARLMALSPERDV